MTRDDLMGELGIGDAACAQLLDVLVDLGCVRVSPAGVVHFAKPLPAPEQRRFIRLHDDEGEIIIVDAERGWIGFCYPANPEDAAYICAALNAHHKRTSESEIG